VLPVADHELPVADHALPVADHELPVADHELPVADRERVSGKGRVPKRGFGPVQAVQY
jgi:hypothetical protein